MIPWGWISGQIWYLLWFYWILSSSLEFFQLLLCRVVKPLGLLGFTRIRVVNWVSCCLSFFSWGQKKLNKNTRENNTEKWDQILVWPWCCCCCWWGSSLSYRNGGNWSETTNSLTKSTTQSTRWWVLPELCLYARYWFIFGHTKQNNPGGV